MSAFDRQKWEARYRDGRGYHAAPDPFLDDVADRYLPRTGRAVDLAGGTGRHARWLARRGLDVTLADISPAGLEQGRALAEADGLTVHTLEIDLDEALPDGPWNVVLISHFLVRKQLPGIVRSLAAGGFLVWLHPTEANLTRHDKPSAHWLLRDGELDEGVPGLVTVHHDEGWNERDRHEVRYVGQKA